MRRGKEKDIIGSAEANERDGAKPQLIRRGSALESANGAQYSDAEIVRGSTCR